MRRILGFLLAIALMFSIALPCYAAEISEEDDTVTGDVYARYVSAVEWDDIPVVDGNAEATTANGYTVSVSGIPDNAVVLRVVPIPSAETAAWNWFADCIGSGATSLSIFDIYFEDADGKRINADGVNISISSVDGETIVFAVSTSGNAVELDSAISNGSIAFTANGSHYYVLAKKTETDPTPGNDVTINHPEGGDVEISDESPEAGDTVTITPVPDEGKEVDKVVVKDEDGNEIPVTDNGDGTYSYVQPNGDVTIDVTFKDKSPAPALEYEVTIEKTTGGSVTVSDKTPHAGDTVTITVDPDDGKKVSEVTVTEESGRSVKATKNAGGTYSYVQPDCDVTIKVTFRDTTIFDNPQTGGNSNLLLWSCLLTASMVCMIIVVVTGRKKAAK